MSFGVHAVDPIAGYDPVADAPSNAYSFDFEGCNLDKSTETTYDPGNGVFYCDNDYLTDPGWPDTGDSYTDGNLGKQWEELDEVPHRIGTDSSGAASAETYKIVIGGDNKIVMDPTNLEIGYDRITVLGLVEELSDASCVVTEEGPNQIGDFGIGGAYNQVVQVVEITQDPDTVCVIDTTFRLAIGSSLISGSSNRAFVVAGTGDQSIPIPSDVQPQVLSKTMSAVEDSTIKWSLSKSADPVSFGFGNTCDLEDSELSKDVSVEIKLTKGETQADSLTATTVISATNPSSRTVYYTCEDKVYGDEPNDAQGEILVATVSGYEFEVAAGSMVSPEIEHELAAGTRDIRNELSCIIEVDDILGGGAIVAGTLAAEYSLPNGDIAPGDTVNQQVVVTDVEKISAGADYYDFYTDDPTGASGSFLDYTPTNSTNGPVTWQSVALSDSATITFTKTVSVEKGRDVDGTLEDTASIKLAENVTVDASAKTDFTTDPKIDLKITKTLTISISSDTDWVFTVKDSSGQQVASKTITIPGGSTYGEALIENLPPGDYTVTEQAANGWNAQGANPKMVSLVANGPESCSKTVAFTNQPAANFFADIQGRKVTLPVLDPSALSWDFLLDYSLPGGGASTAEDDTLSVGSNDNFASFDLSGGVFAAGADEGQYKITETEKAGWVQQKALETLVVSGCFDTSLNKTTQGEDACIFSVAYLAQLGCTFQCTITNIQNGKIVVKKLTEPTTSTQEFAFGGALVGNLGHNETLELEVPPGQYTVTETEVAGWDLTDISCQEAVVGSAGASSGNLGTATATFNVDPGETVTCTFTNVERAMVDVTKTERNGAPSMDFHFEIRKGASTSSDGTVIAKATTTTTVYTEVDFACFAGEPDCEDVGGVAKLLPGDYQFCETGVLPGWTTSIMNYFVPNSQSPEADNSTYCVNFTLSAGESRSFTVDNTPPPEGDARTIGFWKNWTGCDGKGNQDPVLDETLAAAGGTIFLGIDDQDQYGYAVTDCESAVLVLDKRDTSGHKQASDPCFNAGSQLLASELNAVAGAGCGELTTLQNATHQALEDAKFKGDACFGKGKDKDGGALGALLNTLAGQLDDYNNNIPGAVCN
ncbi:prealbumin-like fold domain-containing protein [Ferrimonas gelatinilytica]|uniref:SpaA-like prealbumin fold domain-containing protein n=1 Tax=Ferrimonas gelatinilytica TaxID=1255257 RepID=A0ABP9S1H8_9GAMM